MTPVILLSDNYVATGSEPWKLPDFNDLKEITNNKTIKYNTEDGFLPFLRDVNTFARPWAIPGTPGLEHRVGGLEKEDGTGNVSYDSDNHQYMTDMRAWKIDNIANDIDNLELYGDLESDTLVVGWGSTYGAITQAVNRLNKKGIKVASTHFVHLNPFPDNTGEILKKFKNVIIPELNTGQLSKLIRAKFLVDTIGINKVNAVPFTAQELEMKIGDLIQSFNSKPVEEPAAEPVEEVVEEPAAEVVEEVVEEPAAEPVEEVVEEPAAEPVEEVVEEPVTERVVERVTERVVERVVERVEEPTAETKELMDSAQDTTEDSKTEEEVQVDD